MRKKDPRGIADYRLILNKRGLSARDL